MFISGATWHCCWLCGVLGEAPSLCQPAQGHKLQCRAVVKKKMHRHEDCCISSIGLLKSTIPSKYDPFQTFLRVFTLIPKVPISHLSSPEALLMCHALAVCGGGFPKAAVVLPCFWMPWEVRISHFLIPLWMICYKHLFSWSFVAQSKKVLVPENQWRPIWIAFCGPLAAWVFAENLNCNLQSVQQFCHSVYMCVLWGVAPRR